MCSQCSVWCFRIQFGIMLCAHSWENLACGLLWLLLLSFIANITRYYILSFYVFFSLFLFISSISANSSLFLFYFVSYLQLPFFYIRTMIVLCMPRSFLFMRVHISVILCDYIFHYIRAFFPLTWYISIFCLPLQLGSQYSLTQFELRLEWTAVDVFGECFWCFCHLIALVVSRSDAFSLFHSHTHSRSPRHCNYLFIYSPENYEA